MLLASIRIYLFFETVGGITRLISKQSGSNNDIKCLKMPIHLNGKCIIDVLHKCETKPISAECGGESFVDNL